MSKAKDRGAVLQFEFDRKRVQDFSRTTERYSKTAAIVTARDVIRAALEDVFDNGGTLVCVVGPKKITVVQRPDAEELDEPSPEQTK